MSCADGICCESIPHSADAQSSKCLRSLMLTSLYIDGCTSTMQVYLHTFRIRTTVVDTYHPMFQCFDYPRQSDCGEGSLLAVVWAPKLLMPVGQQMFPSMKRWRAPWLPALSGGGRWDHRGFPREATGWRQGDLWLWMMAVMLAGTVIWFKVL